MARREKTNRVKRLMKEEALPRGERYKTTLADCKKWFRIINEELFEGTLPQVSFQFKWLRVCWAYYEYFPRKPDKTESIIMHNEYPSHRLFVEVLAHEMVHHWQYINSGWKNVDHGDEFKNWSKKAKRLGLRIGEEQDE